MPKPDEVAPATVIMPAFNHEAYIETAIRSVCSQTYPRVELVVIDDASTDATADIAAGLAAELGFTFYGNETNLGLNASYEKGIALSTGSYLSILASDDVILPDKIAKQVAYLENTGRDAVYSTGYKLWDGDRIELIDGDELDKMFADGSFLNKAYCDDTSGPLFQSGLFKRGALASLFHYRMRFKSDDWITLIKLLENYDVGFLNEPLFYYRQHADNSYRNYWTTFPMRIDVIAHATPESLRPRALANLYYSQAQYLYLDGKKGLSLKFLLSSIIMYPNLRYAGGLVADAIKGMVKRALRRRRMIPVDAARMKATLSASNGADGSEPAEAGNRLGKGDAR